MADLRKRSGKAAKKGGSQISANKRKKIEVNQGVWCVDERFIVMRSDHAKKEAMKKIG